jgi:hypothetical protein
MSHAAPLFVYKLRFFFGPAFRGRLGPLAYLGLVSLFGLYGYLLGSGLGEGLRSLPPAQAASLLSAPLAGLLALGFLYSLGSGVTAHASEFDFFMTAPVRPREYLAADLIFQFASLFAAGGVASTLAAAGIFLALHRPLAFAVPFLLVFLAYAGLVLMIIQVLVILGVRYPKFPLRYATLALLVLSLLPAVSIVAPSFPLSFESLPIPSSAFAAIGYGLLMGSPIGVQPVAVAAAYLVAIGAVWYALSDTYIFHGIHPSLSAGFGQVDMAARMRQQQRLIGGFSRVTKRIPLRTDRGGDISLMARLHLIRILRDGSLVFIALFGAISLLLSRSSANSPGAGAGSQIAITNIILLLLGILALNWSYYDRENLWVVVTSPKTAGPYFRGMMLGLATVGLLAIGAILLALQLFVPRSLAMSDLALPITAQVGAAVAATMLLTRLKIKPSAFSLGMLALLFLPEVFGLLVGLAGEGIVVAAQGVLGLGPILAASVAGLYAIGIVLLGLWVVGWLGKTFRM